MNEKSMSKNKRIKPSNTLWGRLFQEAGHHCAFCPEKEPASLQIHHIDENRSNNQIENLIMVCATCHAKITGRVIPESEVRSKKRQLAVEKSSGAFSSADLLFAPNDPDSPVDMNSFHLEIDTGSPFE